jgi:hypothetical protein
MHLVNALEPFQTGVVLMSSDKKIARMYPGGQMFIHSGWLKVGRTEAGLAYLVVHEMAHVGQLFNRFRTLRSCLPSCLRDMSDANNS